MKRFSLLSLGAALAISLTGMQVKADEAGGIVPIYRYFQSNRDGTRRDHFSTRSLVEGNEAAWGGWRPDGTFFNLFQKKGPGMHALYRCRKYGVGYHFVSESKYCEDPDFYERDLREHENPEHGAILGYAYKEKQPGTHGICRFYSVGYDDHVTQPCSWRKPVDDNDYQSYDGSFPYHYVREKVLGFGPAQPHDLGNLQDDESSDDDTP